ncbi:MAG: hypothetical protein R6U91_02730 [Bacillota bacterium]
MDDGLPAALLHLCEILRDGPGATVCFEAQMIDGDFEEGIVFDCGKLDELVVSSTGATC